MKVITKLRLMAIVLLSFASLNNAMNALNLGADQTASGISETKIGTQKLNSAAQDLKAVV